MKRRTLLKVGAVTGALIAVAGGSLALLRPGMQSGRFTAAGRAAFEAIASAVLDGALPLEPAQRRAAVDAELHRLETTIAGLPPAQQAEVAELATLLANPPTRLALTGLTTDWAAAGIAEVQAMLQALRLSSLALRRQVYHALRDLTQAAYFADPTGWAAIGYPGPRAV